MVDAAAYGTCDPVAEEVWTPPAANHSRFASNVLSEAGTTTSTYVYGITLDAAGAPRDLKLILRLGEPGHPVVVRAPYPGPTPTDIFPDSDPADAALAAASLAALRASPDSAAFWSAGTSMLWLKIVLPTSGTLMDCLERSVRVR